MPKNVAITATRRVGYEGDLIIRDAIRKYTRVGDTVYHGACRGGDGQAAYYAFTTKRKSFAVVPFDMSQVWADWDAYSDDCEYMAAGTTYMDRNARLVALGDMLLAFPATRAEELRSGTWSTIRRARKAGKRIVIVPLDGTEPWEEN